MPQKKIRFMSLIVLSVALLLSLSAISAQDATYNESPMLAEMVEAGDLPPVAERLPSEPLVMDVVDEIGTYGGTIRRGFLGPSDYNNHTRMVYDALVRFNATGDEVVPHIAQSLEPNEDFTVWTLGLREGAKWSDGEAFTSEDIMFWVENVALNEELNAEPPSWIVNGDGTTASITAPDEFTVVFEYNSNNTAFPLELANKDGADRTIAPFLPAHYMEQFHPNFVGDDELNALVEAEGFTGWAEMFTNKAFPPDNIERPTMAAWYPVTSLADQTFRIVRNPYYFAVDPEGNQLPYLDEIVFDFYSDRETLNLAAIAGDIDFQARHMQTTNFPVFLDSADTSGYEVVNLPSFGGSFTLLFNMTTEDMAMRDLFNVAEFRQGLSHALDRDAINELVWLGLGEPRQAVPPPFHPYYPGDEAAFAFTAYDVDMANELLDTAGLAERDGDGFRLMPSGDPLTLVVEGAANAVGVDTLELVEQYWEDVGVRTEVDLYERSLFFERSNGNQHMITFWQMDTSAFPFSANPKTQPSKASGITDWGRLWIVWYQTGGAEGEEPPQWVMDLEDLHRQGQTVGTEEQIAIAQEIYDFWARELVHIGTVGLNPNVFIKNAAIQNFPDVVGNDWPLRTPGNINPEQIFLAE